MGNILAPSEPYAKFSIHALELNGSNCSKSYQPQHDAQHNFSSDAPEFLEVAFKFALGGKSLIPCHRYSCQTEISPPHKANTHFILLSGGLVH
jgi:hypothetical protein